jgi:GNAT superfamily N-acetyltransferase
MPEIKLRSALEGDAEELARLTTELGYPTSADEMSTRLHAILLRSDYFTAVADSEQEVVGYVGAAVGHLYERNGSYGRVVALVVSEQHRGRGIGKALLQFAEDWMWSCGASVVVVNSGDHRADAHHFYESQGYRRTGLRFAKERE